jgi:D-alanine-D-alanine ligase
MRAAVLRDDVDGSGRADDLDNLQEADFVGRILSERYETIQIPFTSDLGKTMTELRAFAPDFVFNLVESCCGAGALAVVATELLETMRIPFTGNRTYAHLLSADKALAKRVMEREGIPTPSGRFKKGQAYILKARMEHASIGLDDGCIVSPETAEELSKVLEDKERATGRAWIAEEFVDGREFNAALLGEELLPPAEMCFSPDFEGRRILTYEAKWDESTPAYARSMRSFELESDLREELCALVRTCRACLELKGYARVDFRMNGEGRLYVIDVNTNPCISPDAGFMAMAVRAGLTPADVIERIVNDAFVS